jgi:hypothetical protein
MMIAFKKDYPNMSSTTENPKEYMEKLHETLKEFFKNALKAPDAEGIMVAKDNIFELLCKVCYIIVSVSVYLILTLHYYQFASHLFIV